MKIRYSALALLLASLVSACGGGSGGNSSTPTTPSNPGGGTTNPPSTGGGTGGEGPIANPTVSTTPIFQNISVHDPSVIKTSEGEYYVFGSHLSSAKTTDLIRWSRVADGVTDANPLFNTYAQQAAEGIAWTDDWVGSWAADVIQLEDGKYYFYYDHCAEDPDGNCISRSYLGVARADSITGPYENIQLILKSGHRTEDGPGVNGESYNGNVHPNAIDPDVFFDKEGRLWMVYGSYSGGIWVMELNPSTGLPLNSNSYGTKLTGGFYSAIEGPFMLYNAEHDYYYLFTSYGGFAQNDGYNMRVARSRNPNGPFTDSTGQDIIDASGSWDNIAPYGNKIIGGFKFASELGLSGTDYAYMAPGHGSAMYDETLGKYLLFFHTRFPNRGELHEVRVHELLFSDDGWPLVAPHRYSPIVGENIVDEEDILGIYQVINHGRDINRTVKEAEYVTLDNEGNVSGAIEGSYTLEDNTLTIQSANATYSGKAMWQWHQQDSKLVPVFSLVSGNGYAVWGTRMPVVDYEEAVGAIISSLRFADVVTSNLVLPTEGLLGATLTWTSSHPNYIATDGTVTRPSSANGDASVTLTVSVMLDSVTETKSFTVTVRADSGSGLLAHYSFDNTLADQNNVFTNAITTGAVYTDETGSSEYVSGVNNQALLLNGSGGLKFTGQLINGYQYTVSYWVYPTAETQHTPSFFAGTDADSWLSFVPLSWDSNTLLWSNNNGVWFDGATNEKIPLDTWSHLAFSVNEGTITVYIDGVEKFTGTGFPDLFSGQDGDFLFGINYFDWDPLFEGRVDEFKVFDKALDATEINNLFANP